MEDQYQQEPEETEDSIHCVSPTGPRRGKRGHGKERSGRNRPRASQACANCRERKTKCTKTADPKVCSACSAAGIPCVISQLGDRRRLQSREQFSELQDRVHQLEALLLQHANGSAGGTSETPGRTADNQLGPDENSVFVSDQADATGPLGCDLLPPSQSQGNQLPASLDSANDQGFQQQPSPVHDQPSQHIDWPADLDLSATNNDGGAALGCHQPGQAHASAPFRRPTHAGPDQAIVSTDEDTPTLECDEESGQARFYGPTSQLHIRSSSMSVHADPESSTSTSGSQLRPESSQVKDVLLRGFWESQPLSQAIIERTRYEESRQHGVRSEYWSPFLENALLACASRMRTSPDIRALGPRYCEQATSKIIEEIQNPQIATIQGFLLLSDYEATRGRDRLGYLYCGMATRIIFDLGLHGSCSALVAQGRLTLADKVSRHLLFLGAYVYDTLWGLYLGRPNGIQTSILKAAQSRGDNMNWSIPISLEAWVGLSTEISEATEVLNNNAVPLTQSAVEHLSKLDGRISRRLERLPSALTFPTDQISELAVDAYGLQIQLRGIRIVLHKRLSQTITANAGAALAPENPSLARSRAIMHDSAVMIAQLTWTYQRIFGIEKVITVMLDNMFVAAALLVTHVLNVQRNDPTQATESDLMWLHCLSDMFQRAKRHYPVTTRMLSTLSSLVNGTSMTGIFGESTQAKQRNRQAATLTADLPSSSDWPLGLGLGSNGDDGEQDNPDWFWNGFGEPTDLEGPDMDSRNMMTWLLSPMEL